MGVAEPKTKVDGFGGFIGQHLKQPAAGLALNGCKMIAFPLRFNQDFSLCLAIGSYKLGWTEWLSFSDTVFQPLRPTLLTIEPG